MQKQRGEDTYTLKVGERLYRDRHHSQLKAHVRDPRGKHVQFDYADQEVDENDTFSEEAEYTASKIVRYRPAPNVPWEYEFKTQCEGLGQTHDSWEPALAFVPRYVQCFADFLKRCQINLKVTDVSVPKKA